MPPKIRKPLDAGNKQKTFSCLACNKEDNLRMVRCDNCDGWFHYICVGVTSSVAHRDWRCSSCSTLPASALIESHGTPSATTQQRKSTHCKENESQKEPKCAKQGLASDNPHLDRRRSLNEDLCTERDPVSSADNHQASRMRSSSTGHCPIPSVSSAFNPSSCVGDCSMAKQGEESPIRQTTPKPKSVISQNSKASARNVRRLRGELQLVQEQQLILNQKEALLEKKKQLMVELEAKDNSLESESDNESCAQVEEWLKTTREVNTLTTSAPKAESTAAVQIAKETGPTYMPINPVANAGQDLVLGQILKKLHALELQCSLNQRDASCSTWLPGVLPTGAPIEEGANPFPASELRQPNRITRDQLAARSGICKELPKFTGNPEEWPLFKASYDQTTVLCGFSDYENLIRLRQALDGPARNAVRNLLLHASCVSQVLSTLCMKFGRPELIIDVLLTRIRDMPPPKENRHETIVDFAIEVQNVCATMVASDLRSHLNNPELEQELVCKLPGLLGPFWAMHKLTLSSYTLEDFSNWLLKLAHGANSVIVPSTSAKFRKRGTLNIHNDAPNVSPKEKCVICKGNCPHVSSCEVFFHSSRSEKWKQVRINQLCRRCLCSHFPNKCTSTAACGVNGCHLLHHPLLHRQVLPSAVGIPALANCHTHSVDRNRTLFKVLPVTLHGNGIQISTFAFFDDGSSLTLIDEDLLDNLNLKGVPEPLCLRWTGNSHRYEDNSHLVNLEISEIGGRVRFPLKEVRTVKSLGLHKPQTLDINNLQRKYSYLKGLPLRSFANATPKLLIGLNNCKLGVSLRSKSGADFEPVAEKTLLGWTIKGQSSECCNTRKGATGHHVFHICDCEITVNAELLRTVRDYICVDNLDIQGKEGARMSKEDHYAMEQMQKFTRRVGGRFETALIWKAENIPHPDSFAMAKRRAHCLHLKTQKDPELGEKLQAKIDHYVSSGYARKLNPKELLVKRCWYLSLFPVRNPNKPGKLRLVWDAAAEVDGVSLNNMLLKGPDLLTSLVSTIRKFRQRRVAIGGDIAEMYHQVKIREEDQNYQRFLWTKRGSANPVAYTMLVMTFGATCSPSSAQYVKNKNAEGFRSEYPRAVQCIHQNHYVDDMLDSVDTEEEAIKLAREVYFIHSKGGFHMRNWISNSKAVLNALNAAQTDTFNLNVEAEMSTEKVLGMWWSTIDDCFIFKLSNRYMNKDVLLGIRRPTKREVLSLIMTIFDPLGLLGFYVMYAKIIFQDIWRSGCGWDEPIHDNQHSKWMNWVRLLPDVTKLRIPRCYLRTEFARFPDMEVHTFVDASENGYGTACYLRCSDGNLVDCVLLGSKTKVAPLKLMSIPRLELQTAVLGARYANRIVAEHSFLLTKLIFWTDSRTVLSWLRSDHRRYRQFVAFRISEVLELTEVSSWRWVPTAENVADEATKWQKTPDFSSSSRWLNGPSFLKAEPCTWPEEAKVTLDTEEELRAQFVGRHSGHVAVGGNLLSIEPERFSTWKRLLRVTTMVIRFARMWRGKIYRKFSMPSPPTQEEIQLAEILLWRKAQAGEYAEEIALLLRGSTVKKSSPIFNLSVYLDEDGLLRLGGRVMLGNGKHPVLLHRGEHLTKLIIHDFHTRYHHANHETVVNEIRQHYWISRLRTIMNQVRRQCQTCLNRQARPKPPKMSCLPPARIASFCRPFSYVGVDYFGPIFVPVRRSNEKRYGVLLTCLTTRAIHLELAYSLSSSSCILAIRNFVARRGSPIELWSDNGTNFKGADRELKDAFALMDKDKMVRAFTSSSMKWRFIPPASPHMGGAWERLVRSVKDVLHNVLLSRNPPEEILRAALMEVEMTVNSRPLTYISISHEEDEALTPNHFLLGSSSGGKPLVEHNSEGKQLRRNWQTAQYLANAFWKRWLREYLPVITRRCKWFDDVKAIEVDDIVYISDPENPRNCWPKGRVIAVKKGADGVVRSALVKTVAGLYERPATKIAVLDLRPLRREVGSQVTIPGGVLWKIWQCQREINLT